MPDMGGERTLRPHRTPTALRPYRPFCLVSLFIKGGRSVRGPGGLAPEICDLSAGNAVIHRAASSNLVYRCGLGRWLRLDHSG